MVNVHEKEIQCADSKRSITPSEQVEKVPSSYSADMTAASGAASGDGIMSTREMHLQCTRYRSYIQVYTI